MSSKINLNFKEFGAGEPVVILHGLFGSLDNWQTVARQLGQHFTVFTLDLRNHGRSPHADGAYNYQILADDVRHFMEQQWLFGAHVLGHSMGGKVAMQLALSSPDFVKTLVVIDIAPKRYMGGHETVFEAAFAIDLHTLDSRQTAEKILRQHLKDDESTIQFLLKNLSRNADAKAGDTPFEWKMNLKNLYDNYQHILEAIQSNSPFTGKTLFIAGGNSNYIKEADKGAIRQLFPQAQFEVVPNAGHWVHADQPNLLLSLLERFWT